MMSQRVMSAGDLTEICIQIWTACIAASLPNTSKPLTVSRLRGAVFTPP
jgi:hypothetical protein